MVVKALIRQRDQALIKPALIGPALVPTDQQNRLSVRVEGKSHSSDLTVPGKPKFFHVGVLRALEGIDRWAPQIGSKLSQQLGMSQQFVLKIGLPNFELGIEGIVKKNDSSHGQIMDLKTYGVKSISWSYFI